MIVRLHRCADYLLSPMACAIWIFYIFLAVSVAYLNRFHLPVLNPEGKGWVSALVLISIAIFVIPLLASISRASFLIKCNLVDIVTTLVFLLIVARVVANAYVAFWTPLFAWDAMEFWGRWANRLLDANIVGAYFDRAHPRHPVTNVGMMAVSSASMSIFGVKSAGGAPMWFAAFSVLQVFMYRYTVALGGNRLQAVVVAYLAGSVYIVESHGLIGGYADFWVTLSSATACCLFTLGFKLASRSYLSVGFVFALTPLALKNTGMLYSVPLILSALATYFLWRCKIIATARNMLVALIITLLAFLTPVLLEALGFRGSDGIIDMFGYQYPLDYYPPMKILRNLFWQYAVNSSYSVVISVFLTALIAFSLTVLQRYKQPYDKGVFCADLPLFFAIILCVASVVPFYYVQFVAAHAERFATPVSDLGSTRFQMHIAMYLLISFPVLLNWLSLRSDATNVLPAHQAEK